MGSGRTLSTWNKRGRFHYEGSLARGVKVVRGHDESFVVPAPVLAELVAHFAGREAALGNSFRPPRDSVGAWLQARLGIPGVVAFVGPILVAEGVAVRVDAQTLRFA